MKLKLTVRRGRGRPDVDVLVTVEPSTSVGDLADFLARSDPDRSERPPDEQTLALPGQSQTEIDPSTQLKDSGIRSGSTVALAPTAGRFRAAPATQAAAVVVVVSGPDEGTEFPIPTGTSIIGRDRSCEVRLTDPMVSRLHARIHVGQTVEIVDMGSSNGLLVGDDRSDRVVVRAGDAIGIGDSVVSVRHMSPGRGGAASTTAIEFNRPPGIDDRFAGATSATPEPPDLPSAQRFPVLPLFAPLVMGVVIYMVTRSPISLMFMALSPLLIIANAVEGKLAGKRQYEAALELFRQDVADLVDEATMHRDQEIASRQSEFPSVEECRTAILDRSAALWSRWPDLPGFGQLRLGLGVQPSRSTIEVQPGRRNNRALWHELEEAIAPFVEVAPVPVVADLQQSEALGIGGPRPDALGVARAMVLQAAARHSPAELVVLGLASSQSSPDWEWLKWLPHCNSVQSPLKGVPLASSDSSCAAVLDELEQLVGDRTSPDEGEPQTRVPLVFVVIEDDAPVNRSRAISLAHRGAAVGVSFLWVAADLNRLPAVCRTFVELVAPPGENTAGFVHESQRVTPLTVDVVSAEDAVESARQLSAVVDSSANDDSASDLPGSISLLSLVGPAVATAPEAVVERWVESRSILSGPMATAAGPGTRNRPATLRSVVGESATGPHVLDLRTQGPHALVGGTTGSGKSELLQSWILGMALTNSPERVNFLLVDYKGGSAFSECRFLPHTIGLVTDLSPHLVRRALTSLSAELRYRETLLHRRKAKDLMALERTGDPEAPPSLVIVVDEFAALVQEVPEFVDGVVDVAQRGRSLGLHLILGTQRPAGVIKDNLRANTNLRIALRVADEADSTDVLGSPEAAAFDAAVPGRAMSRTGPSQLVPFQSAYVGGWTSAEAPPPDIEVVTFGFGPRILWEDVTEAGVIERDPGPTDIQRLVANVQSAHSLAGLPTPRRPWLEELAPVYDLTMLPSPRRDDELVFGVVDDPERQLQPTISFRPDVDGNLAVFGTGNSGKSTLLRTIAIASGFTVRGGPCQVYGLDFGSRGLQMLEELPHVGSIIAGSDTERVTRLLGMLHDLIDERANRYAKAGAGTITAYREIAGATREPRILLLVDGVSAFRSAYEGNEFGRLLEEFLGIAADGRPVGVHVILSADRPGALPVALASQVQRRVVLRLADTTDYSTFGLPTDVLNQNSPPGRGMIDDKELQVAVLGKSGDVSQQSHEIGRLAVAMRDAGVEEAPPVERLSDFVPLEDLHVHGRTKPVLGLSGVTLEPVEIEPSGTFTIAGTPGSGRTTTLMTVIEAVRSWRADTRLFYVGNHRSPVLASFAWERSATSSDEVNTLAGDLPGIAGEAGGDSPLCLGVIEGIAEFLNGPNDFSLQEMVKAMTAQGHFIVSDGEALSLSGSFPLIASARSSRSGIVLQPDQSDGVLFRAQFPRLRRADFPPGRGLYVPRGGLPSVVQVAISAMGRTPH